ncbi:MAG TPA: dipeptide epimerase [Candidatus Cybelea sp.]|jgi:L-alanine-DL-glutamate epimerase-like enolase superfamily enzyme|nr:dipeptide epimerase [Candidatus Cybelea sp.]
MPEMTIDVTPMDLPLVHVFKIARGEEAVARTALVRVKAGDWEGLGEATPVERYGESVESVIAYFDAHPLTGDDPFQLETLLDARIPAAARGGLDLALHDLIGKQLGKPLYALLGLDPSQAATTSFTIGIAEPDEMLRKVDEAAGYPILKVKVGGGAPADDVETIAAIRARYGGAIRIDANEGWSVQDAITTLRELQRYEIEFCEQPVPAGNPEWLRAIRERVDIPIVADEDCLVATDIPPLVGCIDGVNVKLAKTGGIRGALAMIHTARAMGLKVMLGCMVESTIAASAAAHLSPLVDWADIDGPLLIADDPYEGISYDAGKLVLSNAPGLGVRPRSAA